jgi:hypothetical protein
MIYQDQMFGMQAEVEAAVFLRMARVAEKVVAEVEVVEYILAQMDPVEDIRQEDMQTLLIF